MDYKSGEPAKKALEKEWHSGESTHLPPIWPGFDAKTWHHTWVEFVVGSQPLLQGIFSGFSGFPPSTKTYTSKFQFHEEYTASGL